MNILDEIAAYARQRVARDREEKALEVLQEECSRLGTDRAGRFAAALGTPGVSFICEVKKASPSKGVIAPDFPYLDIARAYEAAGAEAISCLTEPKWFLGSDKIFGDIRAAVRTPMLRKDFAVDEYQIYQARCLGADAVLLICAILNDRAIRDMRELADRLGMDALVEAHDEREVKRALDAGAAIVGVNNRNLKDFSVDTSNSGRLRSLVPDGVLFVSESGVKTHEDVARIRDMGADAVLVGETLMRAADKKEKLAYLRGAL
ncbi:MAG: indole-3-glycerol phosphate synthase TrpC [Oscillospiraceae bacterium]|nr:indole-3-glycerol phosphate synthase TrpC [Oscillospiraceae bacterium]